MELTKAQQAVLHYIKERCEQSRPPTYRDIQEQFGYGSVNAAQSHVKALRKKGLLDANALTPVGFRPQTFRRIPVYGEIVAGSPVEAGQMELGAVQVPESLLRGPCFALRVKGDSMVNAGILEGDFVLVKQKAAIREGDIVVALVNGENTLKRYSKRGSQVWLLPENARMKPIPVTGDLQIQGKVVLVQRWIK